MKIFFTWLYNADSHFVYQNHFLQRIKSELKEQYLYNEKYNLFSMAPELENFNNFMGEIQHFGFRQSETKLKFKRCRLISYQKSKAKYKSDQNPEFGIALEFVSEPYELLFKNDKSFTIRHENEAIEVFFDELDAKDFRYFLTNN